MGSGLVSLTEVWKRGKLQSEIPRAIRRCVVKVYKKGEPGSEGLSRAFAICTATMQKAGQVKRGSRRLTKRGVGKATWFAEKPNARSQDQEYERIVKSAREKAP